MGDEPVDIKSYASTWRQAKEDIEAWLTHPVRMEIEPGRFLVAESGYLVTEVRAVKKVGRRNFDHVCAKAWGDWLKHQTLLINEKRLNMMNAEDRKYLAGEMDKFFSGEEYAKADGYVPPAQ